MMWPFGELSGYFIQAGSAGISGILAFEPKVGMVSKVGTGPSGLGGHSGCTNASGGGRARCFGRDINRLLRRTRKLKPANPLLLYH
jgi:hypothetical protein